MARRGDLARREKWSRRQCQEYAELEADVQHQCCTDASNWFRSPVRRTVYRAAHLHMEAVEVAPDGFFVVSQYVVRDDHLELRGYELGQRIGDIIIANELGFGTEIEVQWWHERRPGADVWTVRPEGEGTEYAELCVAVTVTPLPRPNNREHCSE